LPHLPDFARTRPGLYTFSSDAIIMMYNKILLATEERPRSLADLTRLVASDPARFKYRLTTYSAASASAWPSNTPTPGQAAELVNI